MGVSPESEDIRTGLIDGRSEAVQRILAAAEGCFCSSGYAATSIREIAQVGGVSKSLLHYHFRSKEHLFLEVLVRIYNRLADRVVEAVRREEGAARRAHRGLEAVFGALRENPDFEAQARVWAHSLSDPSLEDHARRVREHMRERIVQVLGEVAGEARDRLPVRFEAAADLLWATLTGLGLQASSPTDVSRIDEAFRALLRIVLLALSAVD
jgi:AcrR family transcriptional regulator